MRIALFSDIHANLPALKACLKNIEEQKPDAVYCLGDLVGYNIWPNEVINEIIATKISERGETRIDDKVTEAAMEDRKKGGYF